MAEWPTGHRWEDYQVKLLDKDRAELGTLSNIRRLRGDVTLFGMYGAKLTFEINVNDPMASVITERERHYVQVLRDGVSIWEGFVVKPHRRYQQTTRGLDEYIEITCLPLARIASWRVGLPLAGQDTLKTTDYVDDGFKWLMERTLGSTAPALPTSGTSRVLSGFSVAADKSEYPSTVELDATGRNMYDALMRWGAHYEVDWDIRFTSSFDMEFETWYPRRGDDKTENNTEGNDPVIFNDTADQVLKVEYGWDAMGLATAVLSRRLDRDEVDTSLVADWEIIEQVIDANQEQDLEVALSERDVKVYYVQDFHETEGCQWKTHFDVGDKITYVNHYLGYGPHDATIAKITFWIDDDGFEHLELTFGDPVPDLFDQLKQGEPRLDDKTAEPLYREEWFPADNDGDIAYPDDDNNVIWFKEGPGIDVDKTDYWSITISSVWDRDDANGTLYPATSTDVLLLNQTTKPTGILSDTYLAIKGNAAVDAAVYRIGGSLYVSGDNGGLEVPILDTLIGTITIRDNGTAKVFLNAGGSSWFKRNVHIEDGQALYLYSDSGTTVKAKWLASTGEIWIDSAADITWGSDALILSLDGSYSTLRVQTPSGYLAIGPVNTAYCHFYTDRDKYYFNKPIWVAGGVMPYTTSTYTLGDSTHFFSAGYVDTLYIYSTAFRIDHSSTTLRIFGESYVGWYNQNGALAYIGDSALYPAVDSARSLGLSNKAWSSVYTDQVYLSAHGTQTADYTPENNASIVADQSPVGGGTIVYVWSYKAGESSSNATWRRIYARGGTHAHDLK